MAHVRRSMRRRDSLRDQELAVAGNCFASESDYQLFFTSLVRFINDGRGGSDQGWLRAYRNLSRFRAEALSLECLSEDRQRLILNWFGSLVKQCAERDGSKVLSYCVRLAPHLLKRRRFDSEFLAPGSVEHKRLGALFRQILKSGLGGYSRTDLRISLALLDEVAVRSTMVGLDKAN